MNRPRFASAGVVIPSLALILLGAPATAAVSPMPSADGNVLALAARGSTLYVGGAFTVIGPTTGSFAAVDTASGRPVGERPMVKGRVYCAIDDGAGGWFVGGQFTAAGGQPRPNLARISPSGSVTPWAVPVIGAVRCLARRGTS